MAADHLEKRHFSRGKRPGQNNHLFCSFICNLKCVWVVIDPTYIILEYIWFLNLLFFISV